MNFWLLQIILALPIGVRDVTATSCEIVRVNLAPGMTTQLVFEGPPVLSLHADEQHFQIRTNEDAPRSIAIIPHIDSGTVNRLFPSQDPGGLPVTPSHRELVARLDENLRTNLFVFFRRSNQLMFELRFVEKSKADYIVNVRQEFNKDCRL